MGIVKSKIISSKQLLLQEFSGVFNIKDLEHYFSQLYSDPEYIKVTRIFSDFTNAQVELVNNDIVNIAYFILNIAPKNQSISNAILVNKPLITAYTMLYQEITREMPQYDCKIFSTFTQAALFIDMDPNDLDEDIETSFAN